MKRKGVKIIVGIESPKVRYVDAVITKVLENAYNIKLSNGKIYNGVQNVSNVQFTSGDYVATLFYDDENTDCRIVGRGKKVTSSGNIKMVRV